MFIDEITLNIYAGKGGDGIVSWRHEKGKDHAGPGGGDGGKGGDVYVKGVRDIARLSEYRFNKDFKAEDGGSGLGSNMQGKSGDDLIMEFPIGSVITNTKTGEFIEVLSEEKEFFLKGGKGGLGNDHFKSSTNQRPKEYTQGKVGEGGEFFIELKLVVDLGLVGMPNAGKSSLLNTLTKAQAKVGNYQFTTLFPNLGDMYGYIIADIPGLIEGASEGKGLGHKFLRHISRTKALLYCVSLEDEDPENTLKIVKNELKKYDQSLLSKTEIVLLTKTDTTDGKRIEKITKSLQKKYKNVFSVSIIDDKSIKLLRDGLVNILKNL
jgi:GTP-binding protein